MIPRVRDGYQLATESSHISNKHEWNNCFIKKTHKILRILLDFICKKPPIFSLLLILSRRVIVTIFGEHGIMAHIPWWLSQSEFWYRIALSNDSVFNNRRYKYTTFPRDVIDFSYLQGCLICCDLSFQCPSFIFVFRYFWWRLYEAYIRWKFSGLVAARRLDKMEKRQWKDCERIYSRVRVGIHWQTHPKSDKASLLNCAPACRPSFSAFPPPHPPPPTPHPKLLKSGLEWKIVWAAR